MNSKFILYCSEFIVQEVLSCSGPSVSTGQREGSFLWLLVWLVLWEDLQIARLLMVCVYVCASWSEGFLVFSTGMGRLVLGFSSGGLCAGVMSNGLGG